MPYFQVDDAFHSHPKAWRAGNAALGLWVRCGAWSAQFGSDGHIPSELAAIYGTRAEIRRLVDVGMWLEVDGGYQMHDYLDHNWTSDQVRAHRESNAERQRRYRERHRQRNGDEPVTSPPPVTHQSHPPSQAKPSQRISSSAAAAVVPTAGLGAAAAAAIDIYILSRTNAPGVRNPSGLERTIRRHDIPEHMPELVALDDDSDPVDAAVSIFGLPLSAAISADSLRRAKAAK